LEVAVNISLNVEEYKVTRFKKIRAFFLLADANSVAFGNFTRKMVYVCLFKNQMNIEMLMHNEHRHFVNDNQHVRTIISLHYFFGVWVFTMWKWLKNYMPKDVRGHLVAGLKVS